MCQELSARARHTILDGAWLFCVWVCWWQINNAKGEITGALAAAKPFLTLIGPFVKLGLKTMTPKLVEAVQDCEAKTAGVAAMAKKLATYQGCQTAN